MKKSTAIIWGLILIAIGALLVLVQLGVIGSMNIFRMRYIWPALVILLGVIFHLQFFAGGMKSPGLLVPGGLLLVYGCLFMYMNIAGWDAMSSLWPVFLVGPGFGLMELKLFSRGKEGSWIPVIILFGLALFFFINYGLSSFSVVAAVVLIIVGLAIILSTIFGANKKNTGETKIHVEIDKE